MEILYGFQNVLYAYTRLLRETGKTSFENIEKR